MQRFFPPRRPLQHSPSPTRLSFTSTTPTTTTFLENSWRALTDRIHNELTGIHAVYAHAIYKEQQEKDVFRRHCVRLKAERDVAREKLRRLLGAKYEDGVVAGNKRSREDEEDESSTAPPPPPSSPTAPPPTTPRSSYPSPSPSPSSSTPAYIPQLASPFRDGEPTSEDGGRVSKRRRVVSGDDNEDGEEEEEEDETNLDTTTTTTTTTVPADNDTTPATSRRQCMTTNHINLMYMPVNDKLVCRVCVSVFLISHIFLILTIHTIDPDHRNTSHHQRYSCVPLRGKTS
jgi:hypothetical protein